MESYFWSIPGPGRAAYAERILSLLGPLVEQAGATLRSAGPAAGPAAGPGAGIGAGIAASRGTTQAEAQGTPAGLILIAPPDRDAVEAIRRTTAPGLPLLAIGGGEPLGDERDHVGPDWARIGADMAEHLAREREDGGPVLILCAADRPHAALAAAAFRSALAGHRGFPLSELDCPIGGDRRAGPDPRLRDEIEGGRFVALVVFDSERSALALQACEAASPAHAPLLLALDDEESLGEAVRDGLTGAIWQPGWRAAAEIALQLLRAQRSRPGGSGERTGEGRVRAGIDSGFLVLTLGGNGTVEIAAGSEPQVASPPPADRPALLAGLLDHCVEWVLAADAEGRILYANPAAREMLGASGPGPLGKHYTEVFAIPADRRASLGQRITWGGIWRGDVDARCADGSTLPVALRIAAAPPGADARGLMLTAQITAARRHLEEALRVQRDLGLVLGTTHDMHEAFERLLETALQLQGIDCGGVYLSDPATGALRLVAHRGLSPAFVQACREYPAQAPQVRVMRSGTSYVGPSAEFLASRAGERSREGILGLAIVPVRYDGEIVACFNLGSRTHVVIPPRTRRLIEQMADALGPFLGRIAAETSLRESEERFRELAEMLPQIVFEVDLQGRVTYVNRQFHRLTGLTHEEIEHRPTAWDLLVPEDRERARRVLREILAGEPQESCEFGVRRKDGTSFRAEVRSTPILRSGSVCGLRGVLIDVSARNEIELRLREAKEAAEASDLAKSEFLADMSHEIRTPMNVIIGMTDLMRDMELPAEVQQYLKMVADAGSSLLMLINDILDLSRIEAGQVELEALRFDLRDSVEEVVQLLGHNARAKGVRLILRYAPGAPRRVTGDAARIRQVLTNLVTNAIKFTARGHVFVEVDAPHRGDGEALFHLCVSDTGVGIAPEKIEVIFDKFTQADASTTRKYGGSGLGLAICRQLVTLMRGTIGAESEPGRGSTFWFSLPLACDGEETACGEPFANEADIAALLALEDEVEACVLQEALGALGVTAELCPSGGGVIERLQAARTAGHPPRFLLLDESADARAALERASAIRARVPAGETALGLVTCGPDPELDARARAAGIQALAYRPLLPSSIRRLAQELLQTPHTSLPPDRTASDGASDGASAAGGCGPAHARPAPAADDAPSCPPSDGPIGVRVLIVEDNPFNQRVAALMVAKLGYSVDLAENGQEALDRLSAERHALVLMDCVMPVMDGFAAASAIRALPDDRARIPIIAMTAHTMSEAAEQCLTAGMDDFLCKPMSQEGLRTMLARWTSGAASRERQG